MRVFSVLMSSVLVTAGAPVLGQSADTPDMPQDCAITSASAVIRVVVCAPGARDQQALITIGRAACGKVLPCGAWIWDDPANAPEAAPLNHDGLNQAQVTTSKGVWVAEQGRLIEISTSE